MLSSKFRCLLPKFVMILTDNNNYFIQIHVFLSSTIDVKMNNLLRIYPDHTVSTSGIPSDPKGLLCFSLVAIGGVGLILLTVWMKCRLPRRSRIKQIIFHIMMADLILIIGQLLRMNTSQNTGPFSCKVFLFLSYLGHLGQSFMLIMLATSTVLVAKRSHIITANTVGYKTYIYPLHYALVNVNLTPTG